MMEVEVVNWVGSHATSVVGLEVFLRSMVESLVAETVAAAGEAVVSILLAMGSLSDDVAVLGEKDLEEIFTIPLVQRSKNQATLENKDDGDTEDDEDEAEDEDDGDEEDEDGGEEEFSGDDGNEHGEDGDDPETGGGSEGDDDEEEEGDEGDEDNDDDEEEEEEDEEDEEQQQRPSKKRK